MELVQLDSLCQDLRDLQGVVKILKDDNESVKSDYEALKNENRAFKDKLEKLSTTVEAQSAAERHKEVFYQEWLEGVLGGKHKRLSTDVSNDNLDVEIKVYRNAAMAVAQLNLYNSLTNVPNKVLALFDTPPKWKPSNGLVEICDLHAVRLVLLREDKTAKGIKTQFGNSSDWVDDDAGIRALFIMVHVDKFRNMFARFSAENIVKSETKYAHFTVKEARERWKACSNVYGPVPKEEELKRQIETLLQTPWVSQVAIPVVGGKYYRPSGVFRGYTCLK